MPSRHCCLTLACLLLSHTLLAARVDKEQFSAYKAARKQYAAANYEAAKATLAPLVDMKEQNDITPYAFFYYGLSAYHNAEPALAEETLAVIVNGFPAWEQMDEVYYWLGQLRCEAQDYSTGLAWLNKISKKSLAKSVAKIKAHFLEHVEDVAALEALLKQYPQDEQIAKALLSSIAMQPFISRDLALLNGLVRDFNISLEEHAPLKGVTSTKKESYNVAIFFPFFADEVDYEEKNSNLFVISLYQGIKAAVSELAEQGITINLFAYDTKKDPEVTAGLLEQEEVKAMDLIIGPLYASTIPLVAAFAQAHQINLFNPLSENADVVGNNAFAFLFQASLETQARKAAEFTLQAWQNKEQEINVGIVYGASKEDMIRAFTYKQCIERDTGKKVAFVLSIEPETAQGFVEAFNERRVAMGEEEEEEQAEPLNLEALTHLYVASKDELVVANVLSTVERLKHPPCIIGHEAWLQHNSLTFDQLKRLRIYLVSPNYIDYARGGIYQFRENFYEQFSEYPAYYACTGYEMMRFLGHRLAQHGVYFQKHWEKASYQGDIFEGVAYGIQHDNQHVPVIQLQKGKFAVCNKDAQAVE